MKQVQGMLIACKENTKALSNEKWSSSQAPPVIYCLFCM